MFDPKNNIYIKRLAFDEILAQQLALALIRINNLKVKVKQIIDNKTSILKDKFLTEIVPFKLTDDQKKVILEIENGTFSNKRMIRLLQGDVGSGKTVVAFISMLNYIENHKQCVLMVPTSILVGQHFETINNFSKELGIKVDILTGKIKGKKREAVLKKLKDGEIDILIGTHTLIRENVEFKDLRFVVIDEQHRFGVEQRMMLINKNENTDILAMSATPIPRTLALTIYNEMELSIIKEKPKNRKEIITSIISVKQYNSLIGRIRERIKNNEKVYWICPLVEESDDLNLTDVKNKYDEFCEIFGAENIAFIHGKMKEKEKDKVMEDFCNNSKKILISTTVIEVGIDVRDATIIVIDHPERFGLSQLHQLRGRVGRGDKQSYCILLYDYRNGEKNTLRRLNIIRSTTNGFTIAEQDLKIRGVGEVIGLKQSGQQDYLIAALDRDFKLFEQALHLVSDIIRNGEIDKYSTLLYLFGYMNYLNGGILIN
jgi:ATP-dependent DNA helicase RecG